MSLIEIHSPICSARKFWESMKCRYTFMVDSNYCWVWCSFLSSLRWKPFRSCLSDVWEFLKCKECNVRAGPRSIEARNIMALAQHEPWPGHNSLLQFIILAIRFHIIILAIREYSALFLIREPNSLGAQRRMWRLGRLIFIGVADQLHRS